MVPYDRDAIRQQIRQAKACIRPNPTHKKKERYDQERYQTPECDRAIFGSHQTISASGHAIRQDAREFPGIRLAGGPPDKPELNVHTT